MKDFRLFPQPKAGSAGTAPPAPGAPAPSAEAPATTVSVSPKPGEAGVEIDIQVSPPAGMAMDEEALSAFLPIAREIGLTSAQAQRLVDLYADRMAAQSQGQDEAWARQLDSWCADCRHDPEIGGPNFEAKIAVARQALDRFGSADLKDLLDGLGIGNHPELVRLFYRIGRLTQEDGVAITATPSQARTPGEILYPATARLEG